MHGDFTQNQLGGAAKPLTPLDPLPIAGTPAKTCTRCGQPKALDQFPITSGHGRAYRRSWCIRCLRAYYRERNAHKRTTARSGTTPEATDRTGPRTAA